MSDEESDDDSEDEQDDDESDSLDAEETRTRFTNYSMTSATIKRGDGLRIIDDRFEKLYEAYDEGEMGELEQYEAEDLAGHLEPDSERLVQLVDEFKKDQCNERERVSALFAGADRRVLPDLTDDDGEPLEKVRVRDDEGRKQRWDCESILSTHSNLYNRPTLIVEQSTGKKRIRVNNKTGLPTEDDHLPLTKRALNKFNSSAQNMEIDGQSVRSRATTVRSKFETSEEKKLRKEQVRLERKERRVEKKANKLAFKAEAKQVKSQKSGTQIEAVRLT